MFWLALTLGGVGLFLGYRLFRVHLIIVGSLALAVLCAVVTPLAGWTLLTGMGYALALLVALQGGYLSGVALHCALSRAKPESARRTEPHRPMIPAD
jgi:hypothetical protein